MKKVSLYKEEQKTLDQFKFRLSDQALSVSDLKNQSSLLILQYEKLLNQTEKLTRISDNIQKKLLLANEKIQKQKEELKDASEKIEKNRQNLLDELSHAASYVQSLLPEPVSSGNLLASWSYIPSDQLGGDSFGYHWIDKNHFAFYILDVCGHGVKSALLSVSVLNAIRSRTLPDTDFNNPSEVLKNLNKAFPMENHFDLYFTLWYGVYNPSQRQLVYSSAGHPPGILINSDTSSEVGVENPAIGWFPDLEYKSVSINIPKDLVSLYIFSDGAYEVDDNRGEIWSLSELSDYLKSNHHSNNNEMEKLYKYLLARNNTEKLMDDFSLLKLTFKK